MNTAGADPAVQGFKLAEHHQRMLEVESAICPEVIKLSGWRTIAKPTELKECDPRFTPAQTKQVPGLLRFVHTPGGDEPYARYRPDHPRIINGKPAKYESPAGVSSRLDCPPPCRKDIGNPAVRLWLTEGEKKADSLASRGQCVINVSGVFNWRGKNDLGGLTALSDWEDVALNGRDVWIAFDSDVVVKPQVQAAIRRLKAWLETRGAVVAVIYLPPGPNGQKTGIDDFFAAGGTIEDLERLAKEPPPKLKPAEPKIELLSAAPATISSPLSLVGEHAYATAWLWVKETIWETQDKKTGEITRLTEPMIAHKCRLFIVRDDGQIFGAGGTQPMSKLGLEINLPEIPPERSLWSADGVKAYKRGYRADPADVFERLVRVIDTFLDFSRSLAPQRIMCELLALFVLATWFLDAFNVAGYLWPNGDRGSGKTRLLMTVGELAYLGQVILAGGSYASLRDLADYRACLGFDDAERINDPRRSDPDKAALLLAGNRRGATVTFKELGPDKVWRTRHVRPFCSRLFSATRLPDPILGSRTIVVPLVRTTDRKKAAAEPLNPSTWPQGIERRRLIDDLWALALAHLRTMSQFETTATDRARLLGRNLEPWQAILAVALWLEQHGVSGLWTRIEDLSVTYQVSEKGELEGPDPVRLVVRGLLGLAADQLGMTKPMCQSEPMVPMSQGDGGYKENIEVSFITEALADRINHLAEEDELPSRDPDAPYTTPQKLGHVLRALRLDKPPRAGGRGGRRWSIRLGQLFALADAYGVALAPLFDIGTLGPDWHIGSQEAPPAGDCDEPAQRTQQHESEPAAVPAALPSCSVAFRVGERVNHVRRGPGVVKQATDQLPGWVSVRFDREDGPVPVRVAELRPLGIPRRINGDEGR